MSSKVYAFIFARGGSKGVPGKNIRPLAGKPLIGYAVELAASCDLIDRVIVSTDDEKIAETARSFGAETPFLRPPELARDESPEWAAWQHAVRYLRENEPDSDFDLFVSVPATSPLRSLEDLVGCIRVQQETRADAVITVTEASRSPYFNMIRLDEDGSARKVIESRNKVVRRQDVPMVYDVTTVAYAVKPDFILESEGIFDGVVKTHLVPRERALDIDDEFDFKMAELLLADRKSQ